jgi:hypothetical protein
MLAHLDGRNGYLKLSFGIIQALIQLSTIPHFKLSMDMNLSILE